MCSFALFGGGSGGIRKPVSIWCATICLTSPSHRVDQVVDCGLWNVGPLLFNGCQSCWILARTGTCYCISIVYASCPEHPKHAQWVTCQWVFWACKNWGGFSFQELCTDPCSIRPCIILLQHEVMVQDEWHNNGPQDLLTVSLCNQNGINKMHLCSLSITYACLCHNPTATMGHLIHSVDIISFKTTTPKNHNI